MHPLALAGPFALVEGQHARLREQEAGGQVCDRDSDAHRPLSRKAGYRHETAHPLRDLVDAGARRVRARLAEARDRAVDDARVDLGDALIVDAEAVLHVAAIVLDDDVGVLRQSHEDRLALGALEVERQRTLVAMQVLEVEAVALAAHGVDVVVGGRLDLDDVGAPVGELASCGWAGTVCGEVEDAQVRERQGRASSRIGHGRPPRAGNAAPQRLQRRLGSLGAMEQAGIWCAAPLPVEILWHDQGQRREDRDQHQYEQQRDQERDHCLHGTVERDVGHPR